MWCQFLETFYAEDNIGRAQFLKVLQAVIDYHANAGLHKPQEIGIMSADFITKEEILVEAFIDVLSTILHQAQVSRINLPPIDPNVPPGMTAAQAIEMLALQNDKDSRIHVSKIMFNVAYSTVGTDLDAVSKMLLDARDRSKNYLQVIRAVPKVAPKKKRNSRKRRMVLLSDDEDDDSAQPKKNKGKKSRVEESSSEEEEEE